MGAFDRPDGSPEELRRASTSLRSVSTDLSGCGDLVQIGVGAALDAWTGKRSSDFAAAGTGVQVRLARAVSATGDLAEALADLRTRLQQTIEDVADYEARADRAERDAQHVSAHLPAGDPQRTDALLHAGRLRDHYEELALDAKHDYARHAAAIAARIDAITDLALPGGHALSPAELVSKVECATGTGTGGLGKGSNLSAAEAWAAVQEWTCAEPSLRLADGTVDMKQLLPWLASGQSPAEAARWWRSLTAEEQLVLIRAQSRVIGNIDGIPAWARDLANREQLPLLRARLERERDAALAQVAGQHYAGPGTPFPLASSDAARFEDKLGALDVIEKVLQTRRQLLVLDGDDGWQLHAAVGIGDVDTADNVAVFTPGFGSTVQTGLVPCDAEMAALQLRSKLMTTYRGNETTATVTWIGYDAPQPAEVILGERSVASSRLAKAGGDRLATFYTGINASRGEDPHLVALGHSYGSTTTGYALRHGGTGVDDAAVFGSAGLSTSRLDDLQVPAGHLYALAADHDHVADLPRFGAVPTSINGVKVLSTHPNAERHTIGSAGHSEYLVDSSTSQYNLAAVTAGRPSMTVPAPRSEQPSKVPGPSAPAI